MPPCFTDNFGRYRHDLLFIQPLDRRRSQFPAYIRDVGDANHAAVPRVHRDIADRLKILPAVLSRLDGQRSQAFIESIFAQLLLEQPGAKRMLDGSRGYSA